MKKQNVLSHDQKASVYEIQEARNFMHFEHCDLFQPAMIIHRDISTNIYVESISQSDVIPHDIITKIECIKCKGRRNGLIKKKGKKPCDRRTAERNSLCALHLL